MVLFDNACFLLLPESSKTENTPDTVLVGGSWGKDQSAIMGVER